MGSENREKHRRVFVRLFLAGTLFFFIGSTILALWGESESLLIIATGLFFLISGGILVFIGTIGAYRYRDPNKTYAYIDINI